MKKYKLLWYDQNKVLKEEIIEAGNKEDAHKRAYLKYPIDETPGPCLYIEEIPE